MDILTLALAKKMIPFGEVTTTVGGDTLTWDGNTDGLVCVETGDFTFYKIADYVFGDEQIKTMTISASIGQTFVVADLWEQAQGVSIFVAEDYTIAMMAAFIRKDGATHDTVTFPEKGLYVASIPGVFYVDRITSTESIFTTTTTELKTIETKYLPEHLQFGTEVKEVGGDTLTWDGNTDGLEMASNGLQNWYRVSDAVLTKNELSNDITVCYTEAESVSQQTYDKNTVQSKINDDGSLHYLLSVIFVPTDNWSFKSFQGEVFFARKGIYFVDYPASDGYPRGYTSKLTINGYTGFVSKQTTVKPMDEKYMPILTSPNGKKFKLSVDDSGAVTATEV